MPNRFKREELKKRAEARKGLAPEQIALLDAKQELEEKVQQQARRFHQEMFPEEYGHIYDSNVEAKERSRGINPMNQSTIENISQKRRRLGLSQLGQNGLATSNDSYELCLQIARNLFQA